MKPCKTLFVLVAASIVMLTSGCSRQTVHPVPIRYNFLDQLPDADPMLLDTDFVSATFPVPGDTLPAAVSAAKKHHPAPIRYRFAVFPEPDQDPMLQEVLEASLAKDFKVAQPSPAPIRYRFEAATEADRDLMLQEVLEASLAKDFKAVQPSPAPIRYRFEVATEPDDDPMLQEANVALETRLVKGMRKSPVPIPFRFPFIAAPDNDPMLLERIPERNTEAVSITVSSLVRIFR